MLIRNEAINGIYEIMASAKERAICFVDTERVLMYWNIGRIIAEEEQNCNERADYGTFLIKSLAENLKPKFGSGFSYRQFYLFRQFYNIFPNVNALSSQFTGAHFRIFMRIENQDKRHFFLVEAKKNNWVVRQLERQVNRTI